MRVLVTGAAGFVGSRLAQKLSERGDEIIALDCFLPDLYSADIKKARFDTISGMPGVTGVIADLRTDDLSVVGDVDVVINEAAMPGLTKSWDDLKLYVDNNLYGMDRVLQATSGSRLQKFIQISTSSVYGRVATGREDSATTPHSPYGVSKLAAENLGFAHFANFGTPFTVLRYFSVYGPGQRPDMAYYRFLDKAKRGEPVEVFGDGEQRRTNTYVDDCVDATLLAIDNATPGEAYNISGVESASINEVLATMREVTGAPLDVIYRDPRPGDQKETRGDITKAREQLGYTPHTSLRQGVENQWEWQKHLQA